MCKLNKGFVINRLYLGSRELGWELWDGKQVIEATSGQIKAALKSGSGIYGLCLDEKGELQLDREGYMMNNIMCKVHIGKLTPMIEDELVMMNVFYYVVGTKEEDGNMVYEVVSSRFARETLGKEKLMALYELGAVAGGMKVENGEIITFDRKEKKKTESKVEPISKEVKKAEEKEKPVTIVVKGSKTAKAKTGV